MTAQQFWESVSVWELFVIVGIVGATVGAAVAFFRWVLPLARKVSYFIDDMLGSEARPGVPARSGIMERLQDMGEKVDVVHHEMFANSGASLRDQTNRIELAQVQLRSALDGHIASTSTKIEESQRRLDDHIVESLEVLKSLQGAGRD